MGAKLWHKAPFLRLLIALAAGIVAQWHLQFKLNLLLLCFAISFLLVAVYPFVAAKERYRFEAIEGAAVCFLFAAVGGLLVWVNDVRNDSRWVGLHYKSGDAVLIMLQEPLVEKANSYKALASFVSVNRAVSSTPVKGKLIVYFKKDSTLPPLGYGSRLVFRKPLQAIKNAGNPGSFNYKTYCLFNGITHQAFLAKEDYALVPGTDKNFFDDFIFSSRTQIVSLIKKYVPGEKESGLAEALLIGYKDDLDKNLVQAYSNTGVVHIIAISGLHLGLIYWLLLGLTKPLKRHKKLVWLRLLFVVASLWLFSLMAGAQPSVLRSALMFTVLALGEVALRRTNIFNTLSFSALALLCINPFWLWDVGFQLSYTAVLSIVLFFRPVYGWFHWPNKAVDFLWKMVAVTIAAQAITIPISVYHFHQVPLLFIFTNFIAVPLSSVVLLGEIALCVLAFIQPVAQAIGTALHHLINWMNGYIEGLDSLPFAVWNGLSINVVQTALLSVFAIAFGFWLVEKLRRFARLAFFCLALFMVLRSLSFAKAERQRKLIVYNVPKHTAIDVISGRQYAFIGDTALLYDDFARNFHLQPSRTLHRISPVAANPNLKSFRAGEKQVVLMDETFVPATANPKAVVDALVLSKNPKVYVSQLLNAFVIRQIVIDGSVPQWKAALWQRDCDSLKIPCYNVGEEGAFVLDL